MLPDNERIEDWFTLNANDLTPREEEVADRWLGADYRMFADYFDSDKNVRKFAKKLENKYDELLEINKKAIAKGEKPPINNFTLDKYKTYKDYPSRALDEAESVAYDWITLENILNNQTKQGIITFRVQEEYFLGNDIWEGKVIELRDCLSTAVTKDGALWFSATNKNLNDIEYGQVFSYVTGELKGELLIGNERHVTIIMPDIFEGDLAALHNHTKIALPAPSGDDFGVCMSNHDCNFFLALSPKEIWAIEARGRYSTEEIREVELNVNVNLMNIVEDVKKDISIPDNEKVRVMNERAGKYIKNYINKVDQSKVKVYQVIL